MLAVLALAASSNIEAFASLPQDPLLTLPTRLATGSGLPVDGAPKNCAPRQPDDPAITAALTLDTAVDMALCHHPHVKAAWAAIKVQAGALGEAKSAYLPKIQASISQLHNSTRFLDGNTPDVNNQGRTQYANLTWRLFDFGARSANLDSANQLLAAALASRDAVLQKVLTTVIGAYFDAMTAQATLKARTQAVAIATDTWQSTQRREANGVAAVNDSLQASTALAKAQLALSRAQGEAHKSRSVLSYAMGVSTDTSLQLPNEHAPIQESFVQDLTHWLYEAQAKHPAMMSVRAQWAASQAKVRSLQAEGWPTVDYTQNHYQNGYPNQGLSSTHTTVHSVGLTLNVPVFDGFALAHKVKGAQAQSEQLQAQSQDTELLVLMEVVKAHADAVSSLKNLQSSQRLLSAAQVAVQSSQKRYDKGAADVLELLSTQSAWVDAQQERVRCLSEWHSARLRLLSSAGVLNITLFKSE
jgi:outer membrane protein